MNDVYWQLDEGAIKPTQQYEQAAGYDFYALEETVIPPSKITDDVLKRVTTGQAAVRTGVHWFCTNPYIFMQIKSRSGTAFRNGIEAGAGTIEPDYTGEIKIKLYNFTDKPFEIKKGERIAQGIIILRAVVTEKVVDKLPETQRGSNGFGSSGK